MNTVNPPEAFQLRYIEIVTKPGTVYSTWDKWSVNNRDENGRVDRSVDVDALFLQRVQEIANFPNTKIVNETSVSLRLEERSEDGRVIREYRVRW